MNFNININQFSIHHNFPELDIVDGAIMDYITRFTHSPKIIKKEFNGEIYYWIKYKALCEKMPLLKIKTTSPIYKRFLKLEKCGLIKFHPENKKGKSFFAFGDKYDLLNESKPTAQKMELIDQPTSFGTEVKGQPI